MNQALTAYPGVGLLILAALAFFVLRRRGRWKLGLVLCLACALAADALWTLPSLGGPAPPLAWRLQHLYPQGLFPAFGLMAIFLALGGVGSYLVGQYRRILGG